MLLELRLEVVDVEVARVQHPELARLVLHALVGVLGLPSLQLLADELRRGQRVLPRSLPAGPRSRRVHERHVGVLERLLEHRAAADRGRVDLGSLVEHRERLHRRHRHRVGALCRFVLATRLHEGEFDRAAPRLVRVLGELVLVDGGIDGRVGVVRPRGLVDVQPSGGGVREVGVAVEHNDLDRVLGDALAVAPPLSAPSFQGFTHSGAAYDWYLTRFVAGSHFASASASGLPIPGSFFASADPDTAADAPTVRPTTVAPANARTIAPTPTRTRLVLECAMEPPSCQPERCFCGRAHYCPVATSNATRLRWGRHQAGAGPRNSSGEPSPKIPFMRSETPPSQSGCVMT